MSKNMTRKEFLKLFGLIGVAGIGGSAVLSSCSGDKDGGSAPVAKASTEAPKAAAATGDPCGDLSGLSEVDIKTRENLKYSATSADPKKECTLCNFWIDGTPCGGCQIIKGPIHPKGTCNSFVPKSKG